MPVFWRFDKARRVPASTPDNARPSVANATRAIVVRYLHVLFSRHSARCGPAVPIGTRFLLEMVFNHQLVERELPRLGPRIFDAFSDRDHRPHDMVFR